MRANAPGDSADRTTWLKGGLCLLPNGTGHLPARCDIEIAAGRIAAVHAADAGGVTGRDDEVIDVSGCLVVPGLVNAHTHSPDNLIKGIAPNLPLELWSLHCSPGREQQSPREVYISAVLGCIEMLHTGTTTVLDHIRFYPHPEAATLDAVAQAYLDCGLRAIIATVVADRPVIDTMPLDPTDLLYAQARAYGPVAMMAAAEQIDLVERFIQRWNGTDGRINCAVGPSGPQRCTDGLLEMAGDISLRYQTLLHTHVLETKAQRLMGYQLYGHSMLRHLSNLGLLTPRTNLVHVIWADEDDLDLIASSGATVVHNPVSNAKLGSGICQLPAMLHKGIPVALGTDSACCNDSNNLLETAKWAALLHNLQSPDPENWIGPENALRLATREGAEVLGLGEITGSIAPGFAADLTLFKLRSPGFVPLNDPVRQLIQSHSGATVEMVMVAGRPVLKHGRCLLVPELEVWEEAQAMADRRLRGNGRIRTSADQMAGSITRMYRRINGLEQ